MTGVLVLRPEPGASATVARARSCGFHAIAVPLFEIEPLDWDAPLAAHFDGLLLTSANALRQGGRKLEGLRGLKVYSVGEQTAKEAVKAGFEVEASGDAGIDGLLARIPSSLKLLHLCGADRREPEWATQKITQVVVYRSKPIRAPDLSEAPGAIALIHSPRAGRRLAELIAVRETTSIAAISKVAADAVGGGWKTVGTAERPTDEGLLALAARLCNKPHPK